MSDVIMLELRAGWGNKWSKPPLVSGHVRVLDDEFTRTVLMTYSWHLQDQGRQKYAATNLKGGGTRRLHQMVYEHYHGPLPEGMQVDHIDRDKLNCVPSNLRAATRSTQMANRPNMKNKTGYRGVYYRPAITHQPYTAWIGRTVDGRYKRCYLGSYPTAEQAAEAVNEAYRLHHPSVRPPNIIT